MRKKIILLTLILIYVLCGSMNFVIAQEKETISDEPFDLSKYEEKVEEVGIPSPEKVENLKKEAKNLYENGDYEKAEKALDEWAKSANWLANIVTSGLEPFYSASHDDRENFSYSKVKKMGTYEELSNDLIQERNTAMVMRAESFIEIGNENEALSLYIKVLDLIDIENWDLWIRAANGLYDIVNVEKIEE